MRKNRLIALIGTLTMAAAGLAAVSAGVSSKKADSVSATYGNRIYVNFDSCSFASNAFLHYWGGTGGTEWHGEQLNTSNYIHVTNEDRSEGDKLYYWNVGNNTSAILLNWDIEHNTEWNRWGDISFSGNKNFVKPNEWQSNKFSTYTVYKVTLHYNDSTTATEYSVTEWAKYAAPASDTGWYTDSGCTTPYTKKNLTADIDLYEKAPAADTYTVSFNNGGGTGSMTGYTKNVGESFEVPEPTFTAPSKKKFSHWSGSDGKTYNPGDVTGSSLVKDYTLTLTAVWKDYDITDGYWIEFFNSPRNPQRIKLEYNGGTGYDSQYIAEDVSLGVGDTFKIVYYNDESIANYFGTKWANGDSETAIGAAQIVSKDSSNDPDFYVDIEGDYDFYFHDQIAENERVWINAIRYTVTYDANGGTGSDYVIQPKVGQTLHTATLSDASFTAPTGKKFLGWSTNQSATEAEFLPDTDYDSFQSFKQDDEVTLYAVWRDKVANGTYLRGGSWGWDEENQKTMSPNPDNNHEQMLKGVALEKGEGVKVITYTDDVGTYHSAQSTNMAGDGYALSIDSNGNAVLDNSSTNARGVFNVYVNTYNEDEHPWRYSFYALRVRYDANTGSGTEMSPSYPTGTGFTATVSTNTYTAPSANYDFDGWNTQADGSGTSYAAGSTVDFSNATEDITLYAQWKLNVEEVTVTYYDDDETELGHVSGLPGDPITGAPSLPTRKGYNVAWNPNLTAFPNEDTDVTAVYTANTYEIIFNSQGGSAVDPINATFGQAMPNLLHKINKTGYDFLGFFSQASGGTKYYNADWVDETHEYYSSAHDLDIVGDDKNTVTLYAQWSAHTYTLSFNSNGGSEVSDTYPIPYYTSFNDNYPGQKFPTPTLDGYKFDGWYADSEGTGIKIEETSPYTVGHDLTLVAHWTEIVPEVTITVNNSDYGSIERYSGETSSKFTVPYGSIISIADDVMKIGDEEILTAIPKDTTLTNYYTFTEWSGVEDGDAITEDITITANFTQNANPVITIGSCEGGSIKVDDETVSSVTIPYGSTVEIVDEYIEITYEDLEPKLDILIEAVPTTDDTHYTYEFIEWNGISEGSITTNTTLTASFEPTLIPYSITYVTNGGTLNSGVPTSYDYESGAVTLPTATDFSSTPEHKKFDGWYDNADFEGEAILTIPAKSTGNKTFYAKWADKWVNMTVNSNNTDYGTVSPKGAIYVKEGLTISTSDNVLTIGSATFTATPNVSDVEYTYNFTGWSGIPASGVTEEGLNIVANFEPVKNKYLIKFVNYDDDVLQSSEVEYGSTPSYEGDTPIKPNDDTYSYTFAGWDKTIVPVEGEATYKATFTPTILPEPEARLFASKFLEEMGKVCDEDGKTKESELAGAWETLFESTDWTKLSLEAKNILKTAKPDAESTDLTEKFGASYDYICSKYKLDNYVGRDLTKSPYAVTSNNRLFSVSDVSTSTWIIASVAIVGIAAVGVFFIYRKRKEN